MHYSTQDGKALIDTVSGAASLDLSKMTCDKVAVLFRAAAGAKKAINNRAATGDAGRVPGAQGQQPAKGAVTIAELNAMHRKMFAH